MIAEALLFLAFGAPVLAALALAAPGAWGKRLKGAGAVGAALALAATAGIAHGLSEGVRATVVVAAPLPGLEFAFRLEPLGAAFAVTASAVALMIMVYGVGLRRAHGDAANDPGPWALLALVAALGAAYAENLFTYFVFHEALTVAAAGLIAGGGGPDRRRAAEQATALLLGASAAFLLPAMVWVYAEVGTLSFRAGGLLAGRVAPWAAEALLALFLLGLLKSAAAPLHLWLSTAAKAPPAGAAAVQAGLAAAVGAFGLVKIAAMIFGPQLLSELVVAEAALAVFLAGMLGAGLVALTKTDLRERLTYSAASHWALTAAAALLASPAALFGAVLQLTAHALGAATLTLGVGAVAAATGRHDAAGLYGLARRMPWTVAGMALAALSLGAAPPFVGAWPRLWLAGAGLEAGHPWAAAAVAAGAVISFAAFAPLAVRALFDPPPANPFVRADAATIQVAAPVAAGGVATVALLFWMDSIARFLGPGLAP